MRHTAHPNIRHALQQLHAPTRRPTFRTRKGWQQLCNAFARWPRLLVAKSDCTTWASCLKCKRPSPRAVFRNWCHHCSQGDTLLWGEALEREHAGSFECGSWDARAWWVPLTPILEALAAPALERGA